MANVKLNVKLVRLTIASLLLATACASGPPSAPVEPPRFNLAGEWDYEGSVVIITQTGAEVEGRWKQYSGRAGCTPGSVWFFGRIRGDVLQGWRNLCTVGTRPLEVRILDENTMVFRVLSAGVPREARVVRIPK